MVLCAAFDHLVTFVLFMDCLLCWCDSPAATDFGSHGVLESHEVPLMFWVSLAQWLMVLGTLQG